LDRFDRDTYRLLTETVDPRDVVSIHAVSLREFKSIMQQSAAKDRQQAN